MSERVTKSRSEPITIAPIESVLYENEYAKSKIKIRPQADKVRIEITGHGAVIGIVLTQQSAHMLFDAALDLAEEIADPTKAKVRGEAKGASNE